MEGDPCGEIGKFQTSPHHRRECPERTLKHNENFPAYRLETQLRPVYSKNGFDQVRSANWLGLHFSGIETNSEGLMRFVMNPYLRRRFPDDDEFGKQWLKEGRRLQ